MEVRTYFYFEKGEKPKLLDLIKRCKEEQMSEILICNEIKDLFQCEFYLAKEIYERFNKE